MILIFFHPSPLKHMFENHIYQVYLFLQVMRVIPTQPGEA